VKAINDVDHLVYASPDLRTGVERIESLLGMRATPGGQHPGGGTRNALVALGPNRYLEIIGPDPDQPDPQNPRMFGIDDLASPRLVTWAARSTNLEELVAGALRQGVKLGEISAGSRTMTEGVRLAWRFTNPRTVIAGGIVPFFIDWGQTPHPAHTAGQGAALVELRAEHPNAEEVQEILRKLGLGISVARRPGAALFATIKGPRGTVELS
jgi:hypothetical protein